MTKHDNRYKTLNYGTVRRVCELRNNKKKQKLRSRIPRIWQQGPTLSNLIHIKPITPRGTFFNNPIKIATVMSNLSRIKSKLSCMD